MSELKAAFGKVRITPEETTPLQGYDPDINIADPDQDMLDDLYARIAMVDDGKTQLLLVSIDICMCNEAPVQVFSPKGQGNRVFEPAFAAGTRRSWARAAGIPADCISVHATHTHTAPVRITEKYTARIKHEIMLLKDRLSPVRVKISKGESGIAANRRPNLLANFELPIDQTLSIVAFETLQGEPRGVIVNYAVHPTGVKNPSNRISSDIPGLAVQEIEEEWGHDSTVLFIQGFSGDVRPLYGGVGSNGDTYPQVVEGAHHLARDIQETILHAKPMTKINLGIVESILRLPTREGFFVPYMEVKLLVMCLGDVAMLTVSAEVFNGYADKIRKLSPFSHTLCSGVANGYAGYIPTSEAFEDGLGGYEMATTPYTAESEALLIKEAVRLLQKVYRSQYN